MASERRKTLSRRRFLEASGAGLSVAMCSGGLQGQQAADSFQGCLGDYPLREAANNPPDRSPAEEALLRLGVPLMPGGQGVGPLAAAAPPAALELAREAPASGPSAIATAPAEAAVRTDVLWEGYKVLRVGFESRNSNGTATSPEFIRKLLALANEWAKYTNVEFKQGGSDSEIRVGFQLADRLPDSGNWSWLGMQSLRVTGKSMNLRMTEAHVDLREHAAIVLHEFGHAMGCIHEHLSAGKGGVQFDERATINHFLRLGWPEEKTRFNVLNRERADLTKFTDFDNDSIMLYYFPPEITFGRGTKQNFVLSANDKEFIAKVYGQTPPKPDNGTKEPEPVTDPQTLTIDGPRLSGAITPSVNVNTYSFDIPVNRTYTVVTDGATQVSLQVFQNETRLDRQGGVRTPDLVNQAATLTLPTGRYRVDVRHRFSNGVGEYGIRLVTGGG